MTRLGILLVLACSVTGCNESRRPTGDVMGRGNPVNDRKNESGVKTLLDQNENQTDIDITANIRKRVVDSLLSVNARNVKIITQDGSVTLQGTVDTPEEKKRIEDIAKDVADANEVTSLLKIEPKP